MEWVLVILLVDVTRCNFPSLMHTCLDCNYLPAYNLHTTTTCATDEVHWRAATNIKTNICGPSFLGGPYQAVGSIIFFILLQGSECSFEMKEN